LPSVLITVLICSWVSERLEDNLWKGSSLHGCNDKHLFLPSALKESGKSDLN
jgi:hypothetical protein